MSRLILTSSFLIFVSFVQALPLTTEESNTTASSEEDSLSVENITSAGNGSGQDLIVIRTVVYEIGILTDDSNNTNSNETQEEIDVTFFDPKQNGSVIDLSSIPVPYQTNVSGVTLTGIAPANFGSINLLPDGTPTLNGSTFPILPKTQVKVAHHINTIDKDKGALLLDNFANLFGLKTHESSDNNTKTESKGKLADFGSNVTSTTEKHTTESSSEIVA